MCIARACAGGSLRRWPGSPRTADGALHLGYNAGRIFSYTIAGALAGTAGSLGLLLDGILPIQLALYVLANLMLIAIGLYLAGVSRVAASLERVGLVLWRNVSNR